MIDLAQCHWVVDENDRLFLASAPSLSAPFRFDCFRHWCEPPRRLSVDESEMIAQAAMEAGMRPMTFLNSIKGVDFIRSLMNEKEKAQLA